MDYSDYLSAGKIAGQVRAYGLSLIKKDASLLEVTKKIEAKIKELGAEPAFPPQISCDEIAAHYCPESDDTIIFKDQVASVDVGIHVNGFIGDCAATVDLSGKYSEMVKASQEALKAAAKILQIGTPIGHIGKAIQETIESHGFRPVRNLSGHGLGQYNIHAPPQIPNYDNKDPTPLQKGRVIAIEPFATNGAGLIHEKGDASVFNIDGKKPVRIGFVRDIQKELEKFNGMPFTARQLMPRFSVAQIRYALNQFNDQGILVGHPPLVEKQKGIVTQAEDTFIIDDKVICTTKKE